MFHFMCRFLWRSSLVRDKNITPLKCIRRVEITVSTLSTHFHHCVAKKLSVPFPKTVTFFVLKGAIAPIIFWGDVIYVFSTFQLLIYFLLWRDFSNNFRSLSDELPVSFKWSAGILTVTHGCSDIYTHRSIAASRSNGSKLLRRASHALHVGKN